MKVKILSLLLALQAILSCQEFVEVGVPENQLISSTVFEDETTAQSAIAAVYARLANNSGNVSSVTFLSAFSSDETVCTSIGTDSDMSQYYNNSLQDTNARLQELWDFNYITIYYTNSILQGIETSRRLSTSLKNQLRGEALFIRAFCHFYLANLFGDIPYIKTTDISVTAMPSKNTRTEIYSQMIADLSDSKSLLAGDLSVSNSEKTRVNKFVSAALLSRVYLFNEDWVNAEAQSTEVINETSLYSLETELDNVFKRNSSEAILQLPPSGRAKYTNDANMFLNTPFSYLSEELMDSFDPTDQRLTKWTIQRNIGGLEQYSPYKYKDTPTNTGTVNEYSMVLRLAELYLIRAEARAHQNKILGAGGAEEDINPIRLRAGLEGIEISTVGEFLAEIGQERRRELFTEWGHRWLDLKRTKTVDEILSAVKPGWNETDEIYPIPRAEVLLNPNLN
ncbi:RagB/SusD family nutrient uptake outer membrane protein [Parachryseolinea silvisoli]|uniref:RagB/SusD family nutrient uptake outer membrane protein n=1 Tax=Parachryseolinea silvisoli TaxID=2873601 RepID=UPI002265C7CE|nr:RagB/SusD family nutrient uptake outer membrane protein [Parachryseolinea silvisoli]MCD9015197.1 RagB/SusD family nutrient uptake outer membrane protein [Parachryseolinea silvisoli]